MSIYKQCDIRGDAATELSAALYERWGRALGRQLPPMAKFVVGGDVRDSTPPFLAALMEGLCRAGLDVVAFGAGAQEDGARGVQPHERGEDQAEFLRVVAFGGGNDQRHGAGPEEFAALLVAERAPGVAELVQQRGGFYGHGRLRGVEEVRE